MHQPTIDDSEEGTKDQFHNRLECIVKQLSEKAVNIVMGDFNAKIGAGSTSFTEAMGTHGLGKINESGEIFSDTCALHNLVIGGGIFPRIHRDQQRSKDKCQAGKTQLRRKTSRGSRRCSSWKKHEGTQRNHQEIVGQVRNFYFVTYVDI